MKIYRSHGQHTNYGLFGVTGIDFCCGAMVEDRLEKTFDGEELI